MKISHLIDHMTSLGNKSKLPHYELSRKKCFRCFKDLRQLLNIVAQKLYTLPINTTCEFICHGSTINTLEGNLCLIGLP